MVDGVVPRPTVYVGPRLLVSKAVDFDGAVRVLRAVAEPLGWDVVAEEEDPRTANLRFGLRPLRLVVASNRATIAPDAWTLLQQTRAQFGVDAVKGVSLDHLVSPAIDSNPLHDSSPATDARNSRAIASYLQIGWGGRQPIAYVGTAPARADDDVVGRRPVVAILDTGCGEHPWLDGIVDTTVTLDGVPIGYADSASVSPEDDGDQSGPLDGSIDPISGHGTFIAGLVRQRCPDADILAWRVTPSDGPIVESDLIATLAQIAELARRHRAGESGGHAIDVLSLSMGYYHETPEDELFDPTMYAILEEMARSGVVIVCSAGNDATSRPSFPAAFCRWADDNGPIPFDPSIAPIVSVGALNPNGTDALFSNAGPWVRCFAAGAAVVSTMPAFHGGYEPVARTRVLGRVREAIDPDDFKGGFAVWSGTSFSAPILAGDVAAALLGSLEPADDPADPSTAVDTAWNAVSGITELAR